MSSLLDDWCAFCEGQTYVDKSHFLALFKIHTSLPEITKATHYFPHAESLALRISEVIQAGTLTDRLYLFPTTRGKGTDLFN